MWLSLRFFDAKKADKKAGDRQFLILIMLLAKTDGTLWGPALHPKLAILFSFQYGKREKKQKRNPFYCCFLTPFLYRSRLHGIFGFLLWISMNIAGILIFQVFLCSAILLVYQIYIAAAKNEDSPLFKLNTPSFSGTAVSFHCSFPYFFAIRFS